VTINSTAKSISSIPEAKLAPPADGGHHPVMDSVVGYLVSAIRSQQRNVVNGDGAFSFSAETEGTIELLESILASKSEKYADPSLRHFFMMNNWRYLEKANKRRDIDIAIFGDVWYQKHREKVQQNLELYQKCSWDKLVQFLKLDIIEPMEHNIAVDLMKEKLNLFNMYFTETCRIQCTWSVHDYGLRTGIIRSLKNTLLPAYGIFIGKFQDFLKNSAYEYIEYGMFDIHDILDNLFLGTKTF